jgi:uncharacterized protein (TIGR00369 family)
MTGMTIEQAAQVLKDNFAPWIQELGLRIEAIEPGRVTLRLPFDARLTRVGGMVCGQAIMAAADTAMVFAVASSLGGFQDMATVSQNTSFFRAAVKVDTLIEARVIKRGRSLVFGEVTLYPEGGVEPLAQATLTYALAGPK